MPERILMKIVLLLNKNCNLFRKNINEEIEHLSKVRQAVLYLPYSKLGNLCARTLGIFNHHLLADLEKPN